MFAIIDIEATGGSPKRDKITEIAVFLHDGNKVVDEFHTLINPKISIPHFISRLTGISNQMVAEAPTFEQVAEKIISITDDAVFVAHNVEFDYSYIKSEFKRLGHVFHREKLCTIDLTRKLIPDLDSYGLDNICKALDIPIEDRHRAIGDAKATVQLFNLLVKQDKGNVIQNSIGDDPIYKMMPSNLNKKSLIDLPEETGVYFMHDKNGKVIYLGKSADIRRRVFQHYQNNQNKDSKRWKMLQRTCDVSFVATGSELLAQLIEKNELNRLKPYYNKYRKPQQMCFGIFTEHDEHYLQLKVERLTEENQLNAIVRFEKKEYALSAIREKVIKHRLCNIRAGLEKRKAGTNRVCSLHREAKCRGACIKEEKAAVHNRRLRRAIRSLRNFETSNFYIIGEGRTVDEVSLICIENGQLVGYGFFDKETDINNITNIKEHLSRLNNIYDADRIIGNFLKKNKLDEIVPF